MKKTGEKSHDASRREFVRRSAAAGIGAAAVTTMPGVATAAVSNDTGKAAKPEQQGYHLTQHILDYYKSAAE